MSDNLPVPVEPPEMVVEPVASPPPPPRRRRPWLLICVVLVFGIVAVCAGVWQDDLRARWAGITGSNPPPIDTPATNNQTADNTTSESRTSANPSTDNPTKAAPAQSETPPPTLVPVPAPAQPGLAERLDRVESEVSDLHAKIDAAPPPPTDQTDLRQSVDALSKQVTELTQHPAVDPESVAALSDQVKQLNDRLLGVEARLDKRLEAGHEERLLDLAAAQIAEGIAQSTPYEAPLAVIRAAAIDDPQVAAPIETLSVHAKTGLTSRITLARQLDDLARTWDEPAAPGPDAGIWDRIVAQLSQLVKIRRETGGEAGTPASPGKLITDAHDALVGGDLAGAVKMIASLPEPTASRAKPWLDDAQARLDGEQAVEKLEAALAQRSLAADTAK